MYSAKFHYSTSFRRKFSKTNTVVFRRTTRLNGPRKVISVSSDQPTFTKVEGCHAFVYASFDFSGNSVFVLDAVCATALLFFHQFFN